MDSTTNPKVKTRKGEGIGVHSLAYSILKVKGRVRAPEWNYDK
jgi:hypothetical protein